MIHAGFDIAGGIALFILFLGAIGAAVLWLPNSLHDDLEGDD